MYIWEMTCLFDPFVSLFSLKIFEKFLFLSQNIYIYIYIVKSNFNSKTLDNKFFFCLFCSLICFSLCPLLDEKWGWNCFYGNSQFYIFISGSTLYHPYFFLWFSPIILVILFYFNLFFSDKFSIFFVVNLHYVTSNMSVQTKLPAQNIWAANKNAFISKSELLCAIFMQFFFSFRNLIVLGLFISSSCSSFML